MYFLVFSDPSHVYGLIEFKQLTWTCWWFKGQMYRQHSSVGGFVIVDVALLLNVKQQQHPGTNLRHGIQWRPVFELIRNVFASSASESSGMHFSICKHIRVVSQASFHVSFPFGLKRSFSINVLPLVHPRRSSPSCLFLQTVRSRRCMMSLTIRFTPRGRTEAASWVVRVRTRWLERETHGQRTA